MEDEQWNNGSQKSPLFGGHENWSQRKESFKLNSTMKVKLTILLSLLMVLFLLFVVLLVLLPLIIL
jgi:hypothetical protein